MTLEKLTSAVCKIAQQAGAYIREERSKFSLESVERKHAHDYVSYVDKGSELRIVSALRELLPEAIRSMAPLTLYISMRRTQ